LKWVTGPEGLANGGAELFLNGILMVVVPLALNTNNSFREPNNLNGNEHYAHITNPNLIGSVKGGWNDLPNNGGLTFFVHKDLSLNMECQRPVLQVSASTQITIAQIISTTPASRCESGR
jgi:hypothetical protein